MISSPTIEVVGFSAALGECPLWHSQQERLYWIDIDGRQLHRWDPTSGRSSVQSLAGRPGSMAFTDDDDVLLVALEHELVWFSWETGVVTPWLDLEAAGTGNRLNDGRTDPAGRFVVGSMYENTRERRTTGVLHQVEHDGSSTILREQIGVSNGTAFDPAAGRAYFADSPTGNIWMWDYDSESGRRGNERLLFDYQSIPGAPDGGCVDSEGCYWSASVHGWAIIRLTPEGVVDRRIEVPVERPTMPCFGGSELTTIFVTSIGGPNRSETPDHITAAEPGSLLAIDVGDTSGIVETPFGGRPG